MEKGRKTRILYLNNTYEGGGAEKITRQLYYGMKNVGIETFLVIGYTEGKATGEEASVQSNYSAIHASKLSHYTGMIRGICANNQILMSSKARKYITKFIKEHHIDIVHINNAHGNYIGIEDIAYLSKLCKVVWTLHDMWAVTGHCAHAFDCDKWKTGKCSECNRKRTYPAFYYNDIDKKYNKKKESFTNHNITFVTPSHWLEGVCRESYLKNEHIVTIHNGVVQSEFKPLNKKQLRQQREIAEEKNIILFAAADVNNEYKGFAYMLKTLEDLPDKDKYVLLVIGNGFDKRMVSAQYQVIECGYIRDTGKLNEVYSLADIFVLPSMADTFPCVALESFASGTPIVAFATGGIVEIVDDKTGWIVDQGNSKALSKKIDEVFMDKKTLLDMSINCVAHVNELFTEDMMLMKYKELYEQIVD